MADNAPTEDLSDENPREAGLPDQLRVHSLARVLGTTSKKVLDALEQADWKKARAARILGISRPTLYRWMKRAGIAEA